VPQLLETSYVQNATYLARKLRHPDCILRTNYVLLKPARIGIGTPCHQDEAYRDPRFLHHELTFWIPLQDVDADQGCMMFIPKSHRQGILTHESPNHDPCTHVIVCPGEFREDRAVACPLPAGGCTIHDQRILHCTDNNLSGVDRYAYILMFGMASTPPSGKELFPWLEHRAVASLRAKRGWVLRAVFSVGFTDIRGVLTRGFKAIRGAECWIHVPDGLRFRSDCRFLSPVMSTHDTFGTDADGCERGKVLIGNVSTDACPL
jgi:Phytanoyl-CoA dioxygenase (PhyH)